jgi:hypothetical protein
MLGKGIAFNDNDVDRMFNDVNQKLLYGNRKKFRAVREGKAEFTDLSPSLQRQVSFLAEDWVKKEADRRHRK